MNNGLELETPITPEIRATAWAIRVIALTLLLYGIARVIVVIKWW
jgi:hypothetical protein